MISFRAFQGGHGPGLAMDFVSTVGVCAFSERMEEAAGPIFRRYPRLEVGPPPPPSAKGQFHVHSVGPVKPNRQEPYPYFLEK
jgi:hypothetical protein